MDCTCHVPRKESSPTSGIVFSAGLKQEAPAPQFLGVSHCWLDQRSAVIVNPGQMTDFSQQQVGISGSLSPYKNAYFRILL